MDEIKNEPRPTAEDPVKRDDYKNVDRDGRERQPTEHTDNKNEE